ncbi:MAG: redoxin domain-containing protein [Actinomycetota bacterium]|nr:redoxin domain-containing protein [Actinomycetota bacterium]MDH5224059.1 redoxin domain-containing protein [Actinomycetota bacterium]
MSPLKVGDVAPEVPGVRFGDGPTGLFFYKVTCPTCQLSAPPMRQFERAFPGRVVGIGQDPEPELARFTEKYGMSISSIADPPPYAVSDAYAIESVPTLYVVDDEGRVIESVGAWDRDGFNRAAATLARLTGAEPVTISTPDDGLPSFKPG